MKMKRLPVILLILSFGSTCLLASCNWFAREPKKPSLEAKVPVFSSDITEILEGKIHLLEKLLVDPVILEAVRESNRRHEGLTLADIRLADRQWIDDNGVDELVRQLMNNPCAGKLKRFERKHSGFPEIFITDSTGLNVCMTNRTSDYYQADEAWWMESFSEGRGTTYVGPIEYDESAKAESIAVSMPVRDALSHNVMGVCKAVIGVEEIKKEL